VLIHYLTRIQFDFGALELLSNELALLNLKRPLLVSDPGVQAAGLVERALSLYPGIPVFTDTPGNPTEAAVLDALEVYRQEGCDGLVALGGGSVIDLAKAVALLATHPGVLSDYGILGGGSERIRTVAPMIAIPTTAGTGSEVGRACSITLNDGSKSACVSLKLIPDCALCDPELTLTLPPEMTAATGVDALTHGIESFLSTRNNPPAEAIALDCVVRSESWLEPVVADGQNREARWQMLMASLEGGMTFQKGLGAIHALSHPLGALGLHHGSLNAVLLPHVLRFNASHAKEKYTRLRQVLQLPAHMNLAEWSQALILKLGLPIRLSELGVIRDSLPEIATVAAKDHLCQTNPRPANAADLLVLLENAL
jgi:alcohol dehydrogenase class IV